MPPPMLAALLLLALPATAAEKLKALIVDGQNNHAVWPKSTVMMKQYLEDSGLFEVEVARVKFISNYKREETWLPLASAGESEKSDKPQPDPDFSPDFSKYSIVISNFGHGAADWPEATRKNFGDWMHSKDECYSTLGHDTEAFEGVGFIATFLRGSEWAATGKVTQEIPTDFPSPEKPSARGFELKKTNTQP